MKLTELKPRWVGLSRWEGPAFYIGVTFDCPHCKTQRLAVLFDPPIDPEGMREKLNIPIQFPDQPHWQRQGDTFETLTLSPSVNADQSRIDHAGHWHGFIQNGEVK